MSYPDTIFGSETYGSIVFDGILSTTSTSGNDVDSSCAYYGNSLLGNTIFGGCVESTIASIVNPISSFTRSAYGCGYRYISTSTPGTNPITNYLWTVKNSSGITVSTLSSSASSYFDYVLPYVGTFNISLEVTDGSNSDTSTSSYTITTCPSETISNLQSEINRVSSQPIVLSQPPRPIVTISGLKKEEEKKVTVSGINISGRLLSRGTKNENKP